MLNQLLYALLAVSTLSSAQPLGPAHRHHQHLERREAEAMGNAVADVQTVVVTVYASSNPTTLQTSYLTSSSEVVAAATNVAASTSSAAASGSVSASSSSTYSAGSVEYYAGQGKGITYSPYTDSGSCKSESVIASDIQLLSDFDIIRVYAPDCSCVTAIMGSMGSSQTLFAGVYYMASIDADIATLATQVEASSQGWDGIYAVAIGNEWVNGGEYSASEVASAVTQGRSALTAQGYSGKVVTVDTLVAYENNPDLCTASDFVAANSHAYWDGNCEPSNAGPWLQEQIASVKSACGGSKDVLICETGWPTQGSTYGSLGVPSVSNQLAAIKSISETVASQVIFFTTYNDYWKDAGTYGVEKYWGIFSQ
ncbi:hypothetical protein FOA43_001578 [Brettanomyces nanus]|uniref:Uncharacterized protein n=1 Tax=Eeniella nana TaxID=13502 RepID=A0A875S011_EENNA|nr:uncharacterized protein FOA43_001578 [Brettanomyces nanus]QPG74253.1 hypothetical protein FOA43_001578 [Brettanomyces nanus]